MSSGAWAKRMMALAALTIGVAACEEPVVTSGGTLPLTLSVGQAVWLRAGSQESIPLPETADIAWDDQIMTTAEQDAVLQLADGSVIRLGPNSRISLRQPRASDTRPVIRLLTGQMQIAAHGRGFLIESYREVPQSLRIVLVNLILDPLETPATFSLAFEEDTAKSVVDSGAVEARAADGQGTLHAGWRAELAPEQPLVIISPYTPTARASRTPTPSQTPTLTLTPSATATRTATRPVTRLPVEPTNTPFIPQPQPTAIPPTATPVPPTHTPQPTAPPPPTDTATPKATPALPTDAPTPTPGT
jgi:hypothetical protein